MRLRPPLCFGIILAFSAALPRPVAADVRLPALFTDNAVLQRDMPVPIWGWADKDEQVTVKIGDQTRTATPDAATGKWIVKIGPLPAGGPYTLTVSGKNTLTRKNVLVGEVWLCSGQSNMALGLGYARGGKEEAAAANYPHIHLIAVPPREGWNPGSPAPLNDFKGSWVECKPGSVYPFSATAYYFGRELFNTLNVPIGLIHCACSNSTCQAWVKRSVLEANPLFKPGLEDSDNLANDWVSGAAFARKMEQWKKDVEKAKADGKAPPPEPQRDDPHGDPRINSLEPGNLYNSMLHPIVPFGIRGVIWYQGESNCLPFGNYFWYRSLFPTLITSWRDEWQEGDFAFYFVQLPNILWGTKPTPSESVWAELREAQLMALRKAPVTGMAVTIDIGEGVLHPPNKQDVGKRLALCALAKTYGKDIVYSGPLFKSFEIKDGEVVISFDYIGGGLVAKGGEKLKGFAIAGSDKKFVWADAQIKGDTVVVSSPEVKSPVAVRYAWANDPECNLCNKAGLPASPFRTDDWPGLGWPGLTWEGTKAGK